MHRTTPEYRAYVNTKDRFLKDLHVRKFILSQKLERMTPREQLAYFKQTRQRIFQGR